MFEQLAPQVISRLSRDLNLTPQQAAGIVGQLGYESAGLQAINEYQPVVPGSRGGFGWAQWTGPRRKQFEAWAQQNNVDITTPEANYGFLVHELQNTPESRVLDQIRQAPDAQTAGRVFTDTFLRPGVPAYDKRESWTERALNFIMPTAHAGTLQDARMPTPWKDVIAKPEYQALSPEDKAKAQEQYFEQVIAPRAPADQLDAVRSQFFSQYPANVQTSSAPGIEVSWPDAMPLNQQNKHQQSPEDAQAIAAEGGGFWSGVGMGLRDPIDAGAQMLRRAVPEGIGRSVDAFGNRLADMGLPVARSEGVQGIDQPINERNAAYEAARQAAGRGGIDWARLSGNLVGTAPLIAATPSMAGAGMAARVGAGAAQGAGFGFLNPVVGEHAQQNFGGEKLTQGAIGGALGGITPMVTGAIGRVISPKASRSGSAPRLLADEGVTLTPGQAAGGWAMRAEDRLMSVPILGDAIRGARNRGNEQLNRAVYNRVLAPIGKTTDKLGREAVDDVSIKISQAYDDVLGKVRFAPDAQFAQDIAGLQQMAAQLPDDAARTFNNTLRRELIEPLSKGVAIDGAAFKRIEAQLGQRAQNFLTSADGYQRDLGQAFIETQKVLRAALERVNPQHASELRGVNQAFAQLTRLQSAAAAVGAADGVFSPAQLDRAVRAADKTARKNSYARGKALMQDLSSAARDRMSSQIPNSGTADRMWLGAGALGAGMINPAIPLSLGAASVPYLPGIGRAATGLLLTSRPEAAQSIANQLQALPPGLLGILAGQAQ